jgi:glutathione reductase (NADPH)
MVLINHLYADGSKKMDYSIIPTAVFCQPELASVGLSEQQGRAQYTDVDIYKSEFKPMLQTLGVGEGKVTMKLVVNPKTDEILGCHMVGDHAAEIIQGLSVALKAGATKSDFDATVSIHPTIAEEFLTMGKRS